MQPEAGSLLAERFELRSLLGRSGIFYTFLALDRKEGREVVVKVIPPQRVEAEVARRLVRRYASWPTANLVAVLEEGPQVGWVRPYVPSPSLEAWLGRARALPWNQALWFLRPAVEQLARWHARGWVHGHLLPANVFPLGKGALTDGGWLVCLQREAPSLLPKALEPRFGAPEVFQGQPLRPASDVYAVGALLYTALTGRPPFAVGTYEDIARQHLREPIPPLRSRGLEVPPAVERALQRWLAKDPKQRPPHAEALLEEWDALLHQVEKEKTAKLVSNPSVSPSPSLSVRLARGMLLLTLSLLLTLVMLGSVGGMTYWVLLRTLPPEVQVPDVLGQPLEVAQRELSSRGLRLVITGAQADSQVPQGCVLAMKPPPGRMVRRGRQIEVLLSRGKELVAVPNVMEQPLEVARERLEEAGLHVGLEQEVWNDFVPEGHVVTQSPPPGVQVEKGSEVALAVSLGSRPEAEKEGTTSPTRKSALVRVVVPPNPATQHLQILVRDENGIHTIMDRFCYGGEEVTTHVEGTGEEVVVEVYLNGRRVTQRPL